MTTKERILSFVTEQTSKLNIAESPDELTTQYIADYMDIKRNTASLYLNQLNEEGLLIKIHSRPVIFFSKEEYEKNNSPLSEIQYSSFRKMNENKDVKSDQDMTDETVLLKMPEAVKDSPIYPLGTDSRSFDTSAFSKMIGFDKSLNSLIQKIMASLLYPGKKSMPLMIFGQPGVGKSFLAKLIHEFCCDNNIIAKDAPLVVFNCAQYANNPELLSSKLFGYVKGAFTGAKEDSPGLFDAADGGILFLDEAHRLSDENQEKFFTFLDDGVFSRLGENGVKHKANVRIILATTENLESSFLSTFRRRLGINIYMPSLNERSYYEKEQMVYQFLYEEYRLFYKAIVIDRKIIEILVSHEYKGNVGDMENVIKYMCASAYVRSRQENNVTIMYTDIPADYMSMTEDVAFIKLNEGNIVVIDENHTPENLMRSRPANKSVDDFYNSVHELAVSADDNGFDDEIVMREVANLLFDINYHYVTINQLPMENEYEHNMLNLIEEKIISRLGFVSKSQKICKELCAYLYMRRYAISIPDEYADDVMLRMRDYYAEKFHEETCVADNIIKYFQYKMQIGFNEIDQIILTQWIRMNNLNRGSNEIYPVIVGHGVATAYSMADLVNRKYNKIIFDSIDIRQEDLSESDMPLELAEIDYVYKKIRRILIQQKHPKDMVILWDDDLEESQMKYFKESFKDSALIIGNASTSLVSNVGRLIKERITFKELCEWTDDYIPKCVSLVVNRRAHYKPVIVCASYAKPVNDNRMEKLLKEAIPEDAGIDVVSCDFEELTEEKGRHSVLTHNKVIAIIGMMNPKISDYLFVPFEEVVTQSDDGNLRKELLKILPEEKVDEIFNGFIQSFSKERLVETLTILDTKKVIENIETCLDNYESIRNEKISGRVKMLVLVHISCLLERLIRQIPDDTIDLPEVISSTEKEDMMLLHRCMKNLERTYHVEIPKEEIYFINEYIKS